MSESALVSAWRAVLAADREYNESLREVASHGSRGGFSNPRVLAELESKYNATHEANTEALEAALRAFKAAQ
jgi:hypothetical protein